MFKFSLIAFLWLSLSVVPTQSFATIEQDKQLAEKGDVEAQKRLGERYFTGSGVAQDYREAFKWYKLAAEQGDATAQRRVGWMYETGNGVAQDRTEASRWYDRAKQGTTNQKQSLTRGKTQEELQEEISAWREYEQDLKRRAKQGDAEAQSRLGFRYLKGYAIGGQDLNEAKRLFELAAKQGNAKAMYNLGYMYEWEQNQAEAMNWYQRAVDNGFEEIQIEVDRMYRSMNQNQTEANNTTPSQSPSFGKEMFEHFKPLAEKGDTFAQGRIGFMYLIGDGVEKNLEEALKWYERAAEQGDANVQKFLGMLYSSRSGLSFGIEKDDQKAMQWFQRAAEQGDDGAQELLNMTAESVISTLDMFNTQSMEAQSDCDQGELYYANQDYKQAIFWYSEAARKGHVEAQKRLGEIYSKGIGGVAQNYDEAIFWYSEAAKLGDIDAQKRLGEIYLELQNYKEALHWYTHVARMGDVEAQYNVALILDKGLGDVIPSHKEAIDWYELAAKQGHTEAQYNLGLKFLKGLGIKEDKKQALHWLRRAAEKGHTEAQTYVAQVSDKGLDLAERKDFNVDMRLAEDGDFWAQFRVAESFYYGEGANQDYKEALRRYQVAAKRGHPEAQRRLINMYLEGKGTKTDKVRAAAWARIVSESFGDRNFDNRDFDNSLIGSLNFEEETDKMYEQLVTEIRKNISSGN